MQNISPEELKHRLDAGEKLTVIDVREPDEYAADNMGAKLVPLSKIMGMQVDELEDMKDQEIIVHCQAGRRSLQACAVLEQMGFKDLKNLTGGINEWHQKYGDAKV